MTATNNYISALQRELASKVAKEHAYRPALKNYIEGRAASVHAVNDPARQACGAPDFVVSNVRSGQRLDLGYIETKDIGSNLDKIEDSDQMKRYLKGLNNLVLTDYLDFRFYRDGNRVAEVSIGQLKNGKISPKNENFSQLETLFSDFVDYHGQTITSAKVLSELMAHKAQLMRDVFYRALSQPGSKSSLRDQFDAFQKILIGDLSEAQFADVYSQTITYGLFTARMHDRSVENFSREEARGLVPRSNPFLRRLFDYVCGADLDDRVVWIVDALCEVYRAANISEILSDFGTTTGRNDPIVHFYENFLSSYDPALRKTRGVWYTPEPVVNFIVRAVDDVLKSDFKLNDGVADTSKIIVEIEDQTLDRRRKGGRGKVKTEMHKVQFLDIATGTGTFTSETIKKIHSYFDGQEGLWTSYVEEHLLPRLHGFEILMAPYAICHLKIDLLLSELGYRPSDPSHPPRLSVFLTNTLEEHHPDADTLFASWLAHEANEASRVKRDVPVMVVYGNPPYSIANQNRGAWITGLLSDYKKGVDEKRINLDDDYVKFIRYAEHQINKTGHGIVAMITNNSFLDGVSHRAMRKHLLETFDSIYIYDLHGSAKKREKSPDGSPDVNVFDIQQGVAISIMVKNGSRGRKLATLHHFDSFGTRTQKYARLWADSLRDIAFTSHEPLGPQYYFTARASSREDAYEDFFSIAELFPINATGIETQRDQIAIKFTRADMQATIDDFSTLDVEDIRSKHNLKKDGRDWQVSRAKSDILSHGSDPAFIRKVSYRPYDERWTFLTETSKGLVAYPRFAVMKHMLAGENFAIVTSRMTKGEDFAHAHVTKGIIEKIYLSPNTSNNAFIFPLYLYPDTILGNKTGDRTPNLDMKIIGAFTSATGLAFMAEHVGVAGHANTHFTPLDLLDYVYGVLHDEMYRQKYGEALKVAFPRIPYPINLSDFWKRAHHGAALRKLHLLEDLPALKIITTFPVGGTCEVENAKFIGGRVYINSTQYFEGVPEVAWDWRVGGYRPLQKWLKDRKGRILTVDELRHWQRLVSIMVETARLMEPTKEEGAESEF